VLLGGDLRARSRSYITLSDEGLYLSICWYRLREHRHGGDAVGQKVPSIARVAAGAFGFLTLIQAFDGPDR
jgi:hypothetical protein